MSEARTAGDESWKPIGAGEWVGTEASDRFPVYTRGNAGEVYPEVFTPLSFSTAALRFEAAFRRAFLATGVIRPEEIEGVPLSTALGCGVFGGYAYLNLSIQRLISARIPGGSATDADANYLGVGQAPPHDPIDGEKDLRASMGAVRYAWRVLRRTELPELDEDRRRVDAFLRMLPTVETSSDEELRRSVEAATELFEELFERHLVVSGAAGLAMTALTKLCAQQLGDPGLAVPLLGGLGDVDSAAPSQELWDLGRQVRESERLTGLFDLGIEGVLEHLGYRRGSTMREPGRPVDDLAEFCRAFDGFLDRHGARGPNEWDTAFDTWETRPGLALALVDRMRLVDEDRDPYLRRERLAAEARDRRAEAEAALNSASRRLFTRILVSAQVHSRARERSKTTVIRVIHGARLRAKELDRRLIERSGGHPGDLWFLLDHELDDYLADPASQRGRIRERRAMHAELAARVPPFYFTGTLPPLESWERRNAGRERVTEGEVLAGLPGCPGIVRGRARVVTDPGDPRGLEPGEVLVAPSTDPSWTPLFVPAAAVVVDVGAVMSHAVIVSRELGTPCVVSVTDATRRIPDGAIVEVDGAAGRVTIVSV